MSPIKFSDFAETIKTSCGIFRNKFSYVDKSWIYHVRFLSAQWSEIDLPLEAQNHTFKESVLIPMVIKFGLNPNSERHKMQIAKLLAKRSAWIALIQSKLSALHKNEIKIIFSNENMEIGIDYAALTTGFNHPWIEEIIIQLNNESHPDPKDFRDPNEINRCKENKSELLTPSSQDEEEASLDLILCELSRLYGGKVQLPIRGKDTFKNEELISYWIEQFEIDNESWISEFEPDARDAELDIKSAKQRIKELQLSIQEQEAIIIKAQRPIRKFRSHNKTVTAISDNQSDSRSKSDRKKSRKNIAKKFFIMWIESLITLLEVESSATLEKMTSINKMTWWRWYNGKTLPPYLQLSDLLKEKIKIGKYTGSALENIPTHPKLEEVVLLVRLI